MVLSLLPVNTDQTPFCLMFIPLNLARDGLGKLRDKVHTDEEKAIHADWLLWLFPTNAHSSPSHLKSPPDCFHHVVSFIGPTKYIRFPSWPPEFGCSPVMCFDQWNVLGVKSVTTNTRVRNQRLAFSLFIATNSYMVTAPLSWSLENQGGHVAWTRKTPSLL